MFSGMFSLTFCPIFQTEEEMFFLPRMSHKVTYEEDDEDDDEEDHADVDHELGVRVVDFVEQGLG